MLFLAPILAQVAILAVGDRTEVRRVVSGDTQYEGSTRPLIGLGIGWQHFRLNIGYGPTLTLLPLEAKNPVLIFYNSAFVSGTYSWQHSELTVSEAGGYGTQNFRLLALASPGGGATGAPITGTGTGTTATGTTQTGTGTTATGTTQTGAGNLGQTSGSLAAGQIRGLNQIVHYVSSSTTVGLTSHTFYNLVTLHGEVGYVLAGAVRERDQLQYPIVQGPRALASARYRLNWNDDFTVTLTGQYATSSGSAHQDGIPQTSVWLGTSVGLWTHKFDPNTVSTLGAGISGSRSPLTQGFAVYTINPVFSGSFAYSSRLARGTLSVLFGASSSPVIDLATAAVDPRIGLLAGVGWHRDRFSAAVTADATQSAAAPSSAGSLSAVGAGASVMYQLSKLFAADTGFRTAYQTYGGNTVIPLSYAVFVGLSFGVQTPL